MNNFPKRSKCWECWNAGDSIHGNEQLHHLAAFLLNLPVSKTQRLFLITSAPRGFSLGISKPHMWLTCCYDSRKHISLALKSIQWKVGFSETSFLVYLKHTIEAFFLMTVSLRGAVHLVTQQLNKALFAFVDSVSQHIPSNLQQVTNVYFTIILSYKL